MPTSEQQTLPHRFRLSVVVPIYNEVRTLPEVVERIRKCGLPCEILLIDDGSTDGTRDLLENWGDQDDLVIRFQDRNRGKGAAVRTGFTLATGDPVIVQDADLEYDPAEYGRLIAPILQGDADVVYGSRFLRYMSRRSSQPTEGDTDTVHGSPLEIGAKRPQTFWGYHGNRLLTQLSNVVTRLSLTDMETGYKVFRRAVIAELAPRLRENGFGIEPEITARLARMPNLRVVELPISYEGRTYATGKKIRTRDALWAVWCILRYGLGR